ncbi:MAG: hypothetical protein JSR70_12145 [Proteobacteria bacterium]|nr:hypothetical protein [Pseudomonadota bacterium]
MYALALIAALAASSTGQQATLPDAERIFQAYGAGDYDTCSRLIISYDASSVPAPVNAPLLAAECLSRQNRFAQAFDYLRRHIPRGDISMEDLRTKDRPGLDALRKQPQWPAFLADAEKLDAARIARMDMPLHDEILRRIAIDQQAQHASIDNKYAQPQMDALAAVNRDNLAWLRSTLMNAKRWPGRTQVGADGSNALWLLLQHADGDVALQRRALDLMTRAESGEVSPIDQAMLTDRVLVNEGKPQHYGSQFSTADKGTMTMKPADTDSEAELDARRAAVGLPSLADYRQQLREMYHTTVQ